MVRESIWFDQRKFENAETRYHEILAARHSGLKIEVAALVLSHGHVSLSWLAALSCIIL